MTNKYLDGYVDVPTRLRAALEKHPDLRVQETGREIITFGDRPYLICQVTVWRAADDPIPSIGSAWEPVGATPYTKNSELMVGYTSALGRALGYMGFGIDKAIASQNEVDARRDPSDAPVSPPEPRKAQVGSAVPPSTDEPTGAQIRMLRALKYTGPTPTNKADASRLIDVLKKAQQEIDEMRASPEDPF